MQFALLSFGFFAIAAVVIDMRLAALSQQQMQVASDEAAVEGIRQRQPLTVAAARAAARDRVEFQFDDDMDPGNGDPQFYGAGPVLNVANARASDGAGGVVSLPAVPVYKPVLEVNNGNFEHGDMVFGTYDETDTAHVEADDYTRSDFVPVFGGVNIGNSEAFLVRLRRTNDPFALDVVPGVSSAGPSLPMLFGKASLAHGATAAYDPRRDGITVRSTSISVMRRAVRISGPGPSHGFRALQRFVLFSPGTAPDTLWDSLGEHGVVTLTRGAGGQLFETPPGAPLGTVWGRFAFLAGTQDTPLTRVGDQLAFRNSNLVFSGDTFLPLVRDVNGTLRVIGFGHVIVTVLASDAVGPLVIRVEALARFMEATGSTAVDPTALFRMATVPGLAAAHASFPQPVLAPVLTR